VKLLPESRQARLAIGIAAVLVGVNLIAIAVDALVPSPEGPRSSSFATSEPGLAAWKALAEGSGRDVSVVRERLSDASLPSAGTVVVLDPERFTRSEARTLQRFAEGGGRVVAGALGPGAWIDVFGARLDWERSAREDAQVLVPAPETGAATRIKTAGEGHWGAVTGALPIVADADGLPVVVVRRVGRGRVTLVADASPLQNRLLGEADNAALALALAGDGPLVFLEEPHGYGEATGLAALPDRFKWALILLCLAALVLIVARWPRLGPPDPEEEPLFPPRRAYVDALAATLAKTRERGAAVESVRSAARERLARRAALGRDADAESWHAAARSAGLSDEEARALQDVTDHDGIAAGRALARLSGGERKRQ
jgi:hypothetical protein